MLTSSFTGFVCAALKSHANKPCIRACGVKQKGQSALSCAVLAPKFLECLWSCVSALCYAFQTYMLTAVILFDLPRCQNCCLAGARLTTVQSHVCKRAAACRHRRFMKLSRPFGESSKQWF